MPTRAGPPEPLAARRVLLVDQPDASQAQIRIGAIAMTRNDPELLPAQVANTVLGGGFSSKLVEELRVKRSLTYGASSAFVARLTGGDFRISTFSKSPTAVETLALALDVEGAFRREPIDPKALDKAKSYLVGQFPLRLETPDALAARLAEIEFFGLPKDELETYVAAGRPRSRPPIASAGGGAAHARSPSGSRSSSSARRPRSSRRSRRASGRCAWSQPTRATSPCSDAFGRRGTQRPRLPPLTPPSASGPSGPHRLLEAVEGRRGLARQRHQLLWDLEGDLRASLDQRAEALELLLRAPERRDRLCLRAAGRHQPLSPA